MRDRTQPSNKTVGRRRTTGDKPRSFNVLSVFIQRFRVRSAAESTKRRSGTPGAPAPATDRFRPILAVIIDDTSTAKVFQKDFFYCTESCRFRPQEIVVCRARAGSFLTTVETLEPKCDEECSGKGSPTAHAVRRRPGYHWKCRRGYRRKRRKDGGREVGRIARLPLPFDPPFTKTPPSGFPSPSSLLPASPSPRSDRPLHHRPDRGPRCSRRSSSRRCRARSRPP